MSIRILFQGDSITDAGRDYNDPKSLGEGYAYYSAKAVSEAFPDTEFEFINRGINGHRAEDLSRRWTKDAIELNPDVVSILIGINDTWHRAAEKNWVPNEEFEGYYRDLLERLKKETHTKIIMLEQFLLYVPDKDCFHVDLDPKIQITRKLAREYADVFIPLDGLFAAASVGTAPTEFASDGVHPTKKGAELIAGHYLEAYRKLGLK